MSIDEQQIRAITYLAARCRPHGAKPWDEPGIAANLRKVAHLNLAEVILATIRAASNKAAESPGVIPNLTGEHWREKVAERTLKRPPKRHEECHHHPGQYAEHCGGCHSDELAGDPKPIRTSSSTDATTWAERCRAGMREGGL